MPVSERLYLDHAATTPMVRSAREAVMEGMERWANPSSPHNEGRSARAALETARAQIAEVLGWNGDVILTSGASEAISLGFGRAHADGQVVSAVEHDAVFRASIATDRLGVDREGTIDMERLPMMIAAQDAACTLVAVQHVNNETGVIQPAAEILSVVRDHGGLLLLDASQSAGKLPLPDADLIAVSAHKLGGPPGIGALLVRDLGRLVPTGGQERGYRGGTENVPAVLGFAAALCDGFGWMGHAAELRASLDKDIVAAGGEVIAVKASRLATIGCYRMPGIRSASQLIGFDMAGIAVSAGSACSSGTLKTSHVLGAMGMDEAAASEVVRVSFGPQTSKADIHRFISVWRVIAAQGRAAEGRAVQGRAARGRAT